MSFIRHRGKTKTLHFKKTDTTTDLAADGVVQLSQGGRLAHLANDSDDRAVGVCRQDVSAADSTVSNVAVEVPIENWVEWEIDTDSDGGAADTDVGRFVAIDTTTSDNSLNVDISDSGVPHVLITRVISATKVVGVLARTILNTPIRDEYDT